MSNIAIRAENVDVEDRLRNLAEALSQYHAISTSRLPNRSTAVPEAKWCGIMGVVVVE